MTTVYKSDKIVIEDNSATWERDTNEVIKVRLTVITDSGKLTIVVGVDDWEELIEAAFVGLSDDARWHLIRKYGGE